MARVHVPELEDEPWFPRPLRDALTDFLQVASVRLHIFDTVAPVLAGLLERHAARGGARTVVDLCSGGGGPVLALTEILHAQGGEAVPVVLTDLYPNTAAFEAAEARAPGRVRGSRDPVDATAVPRELGGVRTLFNALHHFRPRDARALLENAAALGQPIATFEVVERRALTMLLIGSTPLAVLLLTPLITPRTVTRFFFTYAVPLIPLGVWWDGLASCMRSYSPTELRALVQGLDRDGYRFRVEVADVPGRPGRITMLLGEPVDPSGGPAA